VKRLTMILWAVVLAAVASPAFGAIVYSGSQNVVLSLGPMTRMDSMTIDLAGIPASGDWDDFKVNLWLETGMPGTFPPNPVIGMGMGTRLAIYAPSGMGMGGVLGMAVGFDPQLPYASNLPVGGLIGPNSSFFNMAYLFGSGEFGEGGGYVGLRTAKGNYGWLHVLSQSNLGTDRHAVILDGWALEDQPGVPILAGEGEPCDWKSGDPHKMHWPQLPDLSPTGIDVSLGRAMLADDFKCTATGPIRDIHIWGSFLKDILPEHGPDSLTFEIRIYTDVPATTASSSRPGEPKWRKAFKPGEYTYRRVHDGDEDWYDPASGTYLPANHRYAFQYNFCIEEQPFVQEEGKIYWLAVKDLSANPSAYTFGWKTTAPQYRWNDDAVYRVSEGAAWMEMSYPQRHKYEDQTLDLAFVITNGKTLPDRDFGDAPDSSNYVAGATMLAYAGAVTANYPTVYHAGSPAYGPMHLRPRDRFYLGKKVSLENEADIGLDEDGANNLDPPLNLANRDSADDGFARPVSFPFCERTTLDYIVTVVDLAARSAYVNVWCDWNRDGDWSDTLVCADGESAPEWAVQNDVPAFPGAGAYVFTSSPFKCWHPDGRELDPIWVRITIAEQRWTAPTSAASSGGAGPVGGYRYGETEDYGIRPRTEPVPAQYDWGDAPDGLAAPGYPVLAANNGARHVLAGPWLGGSDGNDAGSDDNDTWGAGDDTWGEGSGDDTWGADDNPDSEGDGQPDGDARGDDNNGDDDEDGVSIPPMTPGLSTSATVKVSGGGVVQLWIDFNSDKTWQTGEKVFDGFRPQGVHVISFGVPDGAIVGRTFARVRISTGGGLKPDGLAGDGEVEDHQVEIVTPPATILPGAVTQCPAVATTCPAVLTECPPTETLCPPLETTCPPVQTQCPRVMSTCIYALTLCPPAETRCPVEETKCPPSDTQCPLVLTTCPPTLTQCQTVTTQCPALKTYCPPESTKCPAVETRCPVIETACPMKQTACPTITTKCPTAQTQCPAVGTQCPALLTICPRTATRCPFCPLTESDLEPTEKPDNLFRAGCPVVEADCPSVSEYLVIAMAN